MNSPSSTPPPFRQDLPRPSRAGVWLCAIRPQTLGLAVSPVVAATALAWSGLNPLVHPEAAPIALACAALVQAGTNLFNDAADYLNGTDRADRLGPVRVTAQGWATPGQVNAAGLLAFLLAGISGGYLSWIGGWPILALGVCALLTGYAYSRGPWPLSRTPLGEVAVLFFFGLVAVAGSYYLQTETVLDVALWWGVGFGTPAAAVLLLNNARDMHGDALAGRRTLAILLGLKNARRLYMVLMATPFAILVWTAITGLAPLGSLAGLATVPMAMRAVRSFNATPSGPAMNALLAATVQIQLLTALATALGMGVVAILD